jgi:hypothetical protein
MLRLLPAIAMVSVLFAGPAPGQTTHREASLPDSEWKRWLDEVKPLLLKADDAEIRVLAPSQRRQFREEFWRARDPDPSTIDNENRTEFERRVATAERRFRTRVRPARKARLVAK